MITLVKNGHVYSPTSLGVTDLLLDGKIGKVGRVDPDSVAALGVKHEILDVSDCLVWPGLIDPHNHLLARHAQHGAHPEAGRQGSAGGRTQRRRGDR